MNPPPDEPPSTPPVPRPSAQWLGAALLLLPFPVAALAEPIILRDAVPICFFRIVTGKPCPFCGLTRTFACATHGHFAQAATMHPLWWLAAATLVGFAALLIIDAARASRLSAILAHRLSQHWLWGIAALSTFELWRIYAGR